MTSTVERPPAQGAGGAGGAGTTDSSAAGITGRPVISRTYYPGLNGLRFVSAFLVICTHTLGVFHTSLGASDQFVQHIGHMSVGTFFALSGFLLFRPFIEATLDDTPFPNLRNYAIGRLLRLVPLYWVALFFYITVFPDVDLPTNAIGWVALFGFGQIYVPGGEFWAIFAAWTLGVEMAFYLVLPLLALLYRRVAQAFGTSVRDRMIGVYVMVGAQVVFSLVVKVLIITFRDTTHPSLVWMPSMLDWFAVGMFFSALAAAQARGVPPPGWIRWMSDRPWFCWGSVVGVVWVAVQLRYYFIYFPTMGQSLARHGAHGLGAGLLLLPLTLGDQNKGAIRALMRSWVFASLGAISYGLYLWHPGFVKLFFRMGLEGEVPRSRWWQLVFVLAASIVVATVTYWGVERPAMDLNPSRRRRRAEARRAEARRAAVGRSEPEPEPVSAAPEPLAGPTEAAPDPTEGR